MKQSTLDKSRIPILYVHFGEDWIRGSERCLIDLLEGLEPGFEPILWTNNPSLADIVSERGITVYRSDFTLLFGWKPPKYNVINLIGLVRQGLAIVHRHGIRLIHANSGGPVQWLGFVARVARLPLLAHLHSDYQLRDRLTLGLHQVSACVGVSKAVIAPLLDDGLPKKQCHVVYNGVSSVAENTTDNLKAAGSNQPGRVVLVSIGSLIRRKGIDLLIKAVHLLRSQGHDVELRVIGDGPEKASLVQLAEALAVQEQVHFLGERPNASRYLHGEVDIYVSGARDEAFGLVLAEAGLASLPVVAPLVGGIPEVIEDNHSGLLVAPENDEELAKAIESLILNPELARRLGANGWIRAASRFSAARMTKDFERLYQELIASPDAALHWFSPFRQRLAWKKALKRVVFRTFQNRQRGANT